MDKKSKKFQYTVVLNPQPEGGYIVTVPALPGCISEGDTQEQALKNIKDAIELYIEDLIADGEPIPKNIKPIDKIIILNVSNYSICKT
ncbi:hypothetical protein A2483_05800 [Candidatus Peregrinibacteria bacterium RIFOXYC2_FULL_33_13]|nr:MAG: hypothetical protein UR27_C0022G0016 [Candidatus Peregrinibacteria bacterium GW2011_GWA2_33_10]KKP38714.1 MAG: hypothetical protein UR30_C0016G0028 [Candidatus Peregrinibacteria bacterium GW2011_GWC2_33_13]OGJ48798.1 MAG: hypothetical protein A2229_03135 [Candidatus Peregrinibacteria bacterium RIFOXYA2_FULL_33_7]OGJ52349.1 MAG: hypothetical protein A2483_05800 [Candidatus Peregrinibacteria bacterium RIFOXYC2_FULL_33_13]